MTTYIFTVRSEKKKKKERRSFDQEVVSRRFGAGATHRVGVRETHVRFIQRNSGRLRYRRGDLAFRAQEPRRISSLAAVAPPHSERERRLTQTSAPAG